MHERTYSEDAPAGYNEHQKYTKYLTDKQIEGFRKDREQDIYEKGQADSKAHDHKLDHQERQFPYQHTQKLYQRNFRGVRLMQEEPATEKTEAKAADTTKDVKADSSTTEEAKTTTPSDAKTTEKAEDAKASSDETKDAKSTEKSAETTDSKSEEAKTDSKSTEKTEDAGSEKSTEKTEETKDAKSGETKEASKAGSDKNATSDAKSLKKIDVGEVKNESDNKTKSAVKVEKDTVEKRGGVHPYRRLAWNDDQHKASHLEEYTEETAKPSQYVSDLVGDNRKSWSLGQADPKKGANNADDKKPKAEDVPDKPHAYR
jgi:hypothetical protein